MRQLLLYSVGFARLGFAARNRTFVSMEMHKVLDAARPDLGNQGRERGRRPEERAGLGNACFFFLFASPGFKTRFPLKGNDHFPPKETRRP